MTSQDLGRSHVLVLRRHTWDGTFWTEGKGFVEEIDESEPLLPTKERSCGPGFCSWLRRLYRHYGFRFMIFLFLVQHVTKGLSHHYIEIAQSFLYRSYNVPATQMQMYMTLSALPWAMKPVLGLVSDIVPIAGYHKTPYSIIASTMGICAFLAIGLVRHSAMPILVLAVCTFFCSLQVVFTDVLTQGQYTEKVQVTKSPKLREGLLTYVWFGMECGCLAAPLAAGPTIQYLGPNFAYLLSAVPGVALILAAACGSFEERRETESEAAESRQKFWLQREVCALSLFTFSLSISMMIAVLASGDPSVNCAVSLAAGALLLSVFRVVLTPTIAKFAIANILIFASDLQLEAAEFYFFTDTPEQYADGPHFSPMFVSMVLGVAKAAGSLLGIFLYQASSANWTYRWWFVLASFAGLPCRFCKVLLYLRLNHHLGIPDWIWAPGSALLVAMADQLTTTPVLFSISYLSPRGLEVSMFALLMGSANVGHAVGSNVGAWLIGAMGVSPSGALRESSQFQHLWRVAVAIGLVRFAVPLLCVWLVPNEKTSERLIGDGPDVATANSIWRRWILGERPKFKPKL